MIKFQAHVAIASYLPITVSSNELRLNQRANFKLYDTKIFVTEGKVGEVKVLSDFLQVQKTWELEVATCEVPVHLSEEFDDFGS